MRIQTCQLLILTLAGLLSVQSVSAQAVTDSLDVELVYHSWRTHESGELYYNCGTNLIGVHDDPIGRGVGVGFYDYTTRPYDHSTGTGDAPQDIPGVQVAVTMSFASGSSPGKWPDCAGIEARLRSAWGGTQVKAYYTVGDNQPVARFDWEQTDSLTVRLDGSESHVTSPTGPKPVASYDWTYGDNRTAAITEHTFSTYGEHEVSLTVTNDEGDEDTMTRAVTLTPYRLTVTPEVLNPKDLFIVGDSIIVEVTVENTGEESVFNVVVPHFTEMLAEDLEVPEDASWWKPRSAHAARTSTPEPEEATVLEEGDAIVFQDTLVIDEYAQIQLGGEWIGFPTEAWVKLMGEIEAESLDPDDLPVKIIRPCEDAGCGTFTVGPEPYRVDGSVGHAPLATILTTAQRRGSPRSDVGVRLLRTSSNPDGNGGLIPQCRSGCIEIEAPIVKDDGSPADRRCGRTKIEVRYIGTKPDRQQFWRGLPVRAALGWRAGKLHFGTRCRRPPRSRDRR